MPRLARSVGIILLVLTISRSAPVRADQISELTQMLSSSSDKTRISAVTALARLGDKRALKPLVAALHDPSAQVRTLSASALGKLGHKAALPALRTASTDDTNDSVRAAARVAAAQVAKLNNIMTEPALGSSATVEARGGRPGFGHSPRQVEGRPDLYVIMNTASDDSPGKHDKAARKAHGEVLKASLASHLGRVASVTMVATDASRWGLDPRHVDLSVVKMEINVTGGMVEIDAQLRLAISDDKGKMMAFLSGGARTRSAYSANNLPNLRKAALENALDGMFDKLLAQLRKSDV